MIENRSNLEHPLYTLLFSQIEVSREGIDFVLSVLRAFEGEKFLHPLLRAIVAFLPADDELLRIVDIVIDTCGVLVGEYLLRWGAPVRQSRILPC